MKKILVVTGIYPPSIGGPATYSKLLFDKLPDLGVTVSVLSFDSVRNLPKGISHLVFLYKILNSARDVKIIYAQDPASVGLPSLLASFLLRKTFFVRVAGDYAWEQGVGRFGISDSIDDFQKKKYGIQVEVLRSVQKFVVGKAQCVITPSYYFSALVGNWFAPKKDIVTIYNGIDIEKAVVEQKTPKTIVSAGRLVPWKGFRALIDVLENLPDWKLSIIGDGPEKDALKKYISQKNLTERVFLLGTLARGEMMKEIARSEIFILNTHFESFSFNVVEAMFLKTPVVTTNIGNLSEIVTDNVEGVLVAPDDAVDIEKAINMIHQDKNFRDMCIENAYQKSLQFNIQETLRKLMEKMQPFL